MQTPFGMLYRNFILPEFCKPCLFLSSIQFAQFIVPYRRKHSGFDMLLVTNDKEIILTEGIADRFTLSDGRVEAVQVLEK